MHVFHDDGTSGVDFALAARFIAPVLVLLGIVHGQACKAASTKTTNLHCQYVLTSSCACNLLTHPKCVSRLLNKVFTQSSAQLGLKQSSMCSSKSKTIKPVPVLSKVLHDQACTRLQDLETCYDKLQGLQAKYEALQASVTEGGQATAQEEGKAAGQLEARVQQLQTKYEALQATMAEGRQATVQEEGKAAEQLEAKVQQLQSELAAQAATAAAHKQELEAKVQQLEVDASAHMVAEKQELEAAISRLEGELAAQAAAGKAAQQELESKSRQLQEAQEAKDEATR